MAQPPSSAPKAGSHGRKPLNLVRIKATIVFFTGLLTGFGSALTGLGAQVAFSPMLAWMLGFGPEKSQATGLRYAVFVAISAIIGLLVAIGVPGAYPLHGLLLFIGATLGAILTAPLVRNPVFLSKRAILQTLGMALGLFVLLQTVRLTPWENPHFAAWQGVGPLIGLGILVGGLTQALGLASGILMVPGLYYLGGFGVREAIGLSLLVVALAGLLPAWSYGKRGLADRVYGDVAIIGGSLGGVVGGLLVGHLPEKVLLIVFALVAMFLCSRELALLAGSQGRASVKP